MCELRGFMFTAGQQTHYTCVLVALQWRHNKMMILSFIYLSKGMNVLFLLKVYWQLSIKTTTSGLCLLLVMDLILFKQSSDFIACADSQQVKVTPSKLDSFASDLRLRSVFCDQFKNQHSLMLTFFKQLFFLFKEERFFIQTIEIPTAVIKCPYCAHLQPHNF